jgi:hypothetical protein
VIDEIHWLLGGAAVGTGASVTLPYDAAGEALEADIVAHVELSGNSDGIAPVDGAPMEVFAFPQFTRSVGLGLVEAMDGPRPDVVALGVLLDMIERLVGDRYTPATWDSLVASAAAAQLVAAAANPSMQAVSEATADVQAKIRQLVLRPSKTQLAAAITLASVIQANASAYVPASISGLSAVLAAARVVYDNPDAITSEVSAAQAALISRIALARLRAV